VEQTKTQYRVEQMHWSCKREKEEALKFAVPGGLIFLLFGRKKT
jgi:hypothetical protein